jgi:hypothetical protein
LDEQTAKHPLVKTAPKIMNKYANTNATCTSKKSVDSKPCLGLQIAQMFSNVCFGGPPDFSVTNNDDAPPLLDITRTVLHSVGNSAPMKDPNNAMCALAVQSALLLVNNIGGGGSPMFNLSSSTTQVVEHPPVSYANDSSSYYNHYSPYQQQSPYNNTQAPTVVTPVTYNVNQLPFYTGDDSQTIKGGVVNNGFDPRRMMAAGNSQEATRENVLRNVMMAPRVAQ